MKNFVLIGHVDNGKSSLGGRIMYETKNVSDHELEQVKKEAIENGMERWMWAYLLDIDKNERLRGKTHEFTTIELEYNNNKYTLIDTPGHKSFIRSMIGGVSLIKNVCGVIVVSAIENEFERGFNGGQIKEDLIIAKACGINTMIVAINKIDAIDYDPEKYEQIKNKINKFSKGLTFEKLVFVPVSAWTGENIISNSTNMKFYDGLPLMDILNEYCIDVIDNGEKENGNKIIKNVIATNMRFLGNLLPTTFHIIASGMTAIMIYNGNEHFVEIQKIYDNNKKAINFVKNNDMSKKYIIVFSCQENFEVDDRYDKFIIRSGDDFIGFGNIMLKK